MQRVARVRQRQLSYLFLSYRRRQRQPMQMTVMQMTRAAIATTNMTASAASRTSGQRIFNKRPHRRGIFDGGQCNQCNVTPTSREHCSRLQQSRCQAVIGIQWSFLLHIPQQWLPMLFRGPDNRQNCPFLWGISTAIQYMVLWAHASQPSNGISIGSSVFVQHTRVASLRWRIASTMGALMGMQPGQPATMTITTIGSKSGMVVLQTPLALPTVVVVARQTDTHTHTHRPRYVRHL